MKDGRLLTASLDRILRGEGLRYSNAERFSEENWRKLTDENTNATIYYQLRTLRGPAAEDQEGATSAEEAGEGQSKEREE